MRWPVLCCLLVVCGCSFEPRLPDLPDRDSLPIRSTVDRRYEDVLAEPESAEANGELGIVLHGLYDAAHAEILYRRAFLLAPREFQWLYYVGVTQTAQDKDDPAAATFRHALTIDPDYLPAKLRLAEVAFRMGNTAECEQLAGELAALPEAAALGEYWRGRVLSQRGQNEAALEAFRKACERFPSFGDAHWGWAECARLLNDENTVREQTLLADRYRFEVPPLADPLMEKVFGEYIRATDQLRLGLEAESQGKLREAGEHYRAALAMDPRSDAAHARLIRIAIENGNYQEALEHYAASQRINSDQADAHANYGLLLLRQGRFQESQAAYEQALRLNPYHPEALAYLGHLRERNSERREAERLYRTAIECRDGFREAHMFLGELLVNERRYEEAFAQFRQVVAVEDEKTPDFLYRLASLYTVAGDSGEARRCIERARELAEKFGHTDLLDRIEGEGRIR